MAPEPGEGGGKRADPGDRKPDLGVLANALADAVGTCRPVGFLVLVIGSAGKATVGGPFPGLGVWERAVVILRDLERLPKLAAFWSRTTRIRVCVDFHHRPKEPLPRRRSGSLVYYAVSSREQSPQVGFKTGAARDDGVRNTDDSSCSEEVVIDRQ